MLQPSAAAFRSDSALMQALEQWALHTKLTNMHTERQLALASALVARL